MRSIFAALAFGFACVGATPCMAQATPDFVFNVPVRIENAPPLSGRTARVQCNLRAIPLIIAVVTGSSGETISISGGTPETQLARYTSTTGQVVASHNLNARGTFPP